MIFLLAALAVILIVGMGGAWFFMARGAVGDREMQARRAAEERMAAEAQVAEQMEPAPAK